MKKNEFIRSLVFLLLALSLLLGTVMVFDRKLRCDYTRGVNGFFNEPEESFDVLLFGSSHMYCTISPLELWKDTGLRSYVLATQQQPLPASYYYMKEAFRHQSPGLVVLEVTMAVIDPALTGEGVIRDALDPLPWSANKIELIKALVPKGERGSYYFNFAKYHSRWKELDRRDFDFSYRNATDPERGYILLTPQRPADCGTLSYDDVQAQPLYEQNLVWLERIVELVKAEGAEIMFMVAPYETAPEDLPQLKTVHALAEEWGVKVLDFNLLYDQIGFDGSKDFFDTGHLNIYGAAKASGCLGEHIRQNYSISPCYSEDEEDWNSDSSRSY